MLPPINTAAYQKTETEIQSTFTPSSSTNSEANYTSIRQINQTASIGDKEEKNNRQEGSQKDDQKKEAGNEHLSQAKLDALNKNLTKIHNIELQFSKHEVTGQTMIKVMDKDTKALIRQIPPKQVLDMAAKMEEMLGMLFDKIA